MEQQSKGGAMAFGYGGHSQRLRAPRLRALLLLHRCYTASVPNMVLLLQVVVWWDGRLRGAAAKGIALNKKI